VWYDGNGVPTAQRPGLKRINFYFQFKVLNIQAALIGQANISMG
jgi:hypothetical protein